MVSADLFRKTLIALLLIEHYLLKSTSPQKDANDQGKPQQIVFLVPSVALALQQQQEVLRYTSDVGLACASTVNKCPDRLVNCRVLVATHGAYLQLLNHFGDLFYLERVDLLILDECHHCTKNALYAVLMRDFYHPLPEESRPRVLGLTASPLINVKVNHSDEQLVDQLAALEAVMDAKVASIEALALEQDSKLWLETQADEKIVTYDQATESSASLSFPSPPEDLHLTRVKEGNQLVQLGVDLGPLVLRLYCEALLPEISRNTYVDETNEQFQAAVRYYQELIAFCDRARQHDANAGKSAKLIALEMLLREELDNKNEPVGVVFVQRRITALALKHYFSRHAATMARPKKRHETTCASHVRQEDEMLGQFDDADENMDLESEEVLATTIADLELQATDQDVMFDQFADAEPEDDPFLQLQEIDSRKRPVSRHDSLLEDSAISDSGLSVIRCASLVRNPWRLSKASCASTNGCEEERTLAGDWLNDEANIREVLDGLRRGYVNVLVATSMVEEGIDVQACSFVVVLDSLTSIKSYIQMKGRARQQFAQFYVFEPSLSSSTSKRLNLVDAKNLEVRVRRLVAARSQWQFPTISAALQLPEEPFTTSSVEVRALEQGKYEGLHGTVHLFSAKSLLYRYALRQPMDEVARSSRKALEAFLPLYDDLFNNLRLPAYIGTHVDLRVIALPPQYHDRPKKIKQNMLALVACIRLHQHGLLTDRMLPLTRQDIRSRVLSLSQETEVQAMHRRDPFPLTIDTADKIPILVHEILLSGDRIDQARGAFKSSSRLALVTFQEIPCITPYEDFHRDFGGVSCHLGKRSTSEISKLHLDTLFDFFALLMNARWKRRTRESYFATNCMRETTIPLYAVGCLDQDEALDWSLMKELLWKSKRSKEERISAVRSLISEPREIAQPLLWCPLYNELSTYIAFGPSSLQCSSALPLDCQEDGIVTHQDFFSRKRGLDVPPDSTLFHVKHFWKQQSIRNSRRELRLPHQHEEPQMCGFLKSALLPVHACMESSMPHAGIMLECTFLPQFLHHVERMLTVRAFVEYCLDNMPTLGTCLKQSSGESVLAVLTAKSCVGEESYERLEWFGDGVLKLICTDVALRASNLQTWIHNLHEGDLNMVRSVMSSNERLIAACERRGLQRFILTSALSRGLWTPSPLRICSPSGENSSAAISTSTTPSLGKVCADVIEAILGFVFLRGGYKLALKVADELTVTIPWKEEAEIFRPSSSVARPGLLSAVQSFTGYTHAQRSCIFEQALTHATSINPEMASYQILEWVGDAALCLGVRRWIFDKFRSSPVGEMVSLEESIVCNETLAFLSLRSGIHKYLNHCDQTLSTRIECYEWTLREQGRGLWGTDPPKAVADIFESLLGAVYIDGGFEAGLKAVYHALAPVLNVFDKAREEVGVLVYQPKRELRELGGATVSVSYAASRQKDDTVDELPPGELIGESASGQLEGQRSTTTVKFFGFDLLTSVDTSPSSATNRACYAVLAALKRNEDLATRFKSVQHDVSAATTRNK